MEIERYQVIMKEANDMKDDFLNEIDFEPLYNLIKENNFKATEQLTSFFEKFFNDNKVAEQLTDKLNICDTEEVALLLGTFSKFIMEKLQQFANDKIDIKNYSKNICPFCNNNFKYGIIKEDGKKYLFCSVCNFQWNFPRIKCPFCGNENQKQLSYFQFEDENEFVRVYKCENCGKLHKVFLSEKMKQYSSYEYAHINTAHIDLFIQENEK